jgi:hypothetical protein
MQHLSFQSITKFNIPGTAFALIELSIAAQQAGT